MKWREQEERELEEKRKNWGKKTCGEVEPPSIAKSMAEPKIAQTTKSKFGLSGEGSWSVGGTVARGRRTSDRIRKSDDRKE